MKTIKSDNDAFIRENLEELVKKYPRQHIVISSGEIFTGADAIKKARAKYKSIPMSFIVPRREAFSSHLL